MACYLGRRYDAIQSAMCHGPERLTSPNVSDSGLSGQGAGQNLLLRGFDSLFEFGHARAS